MNLLAVLWLNKRVMSIILSAALLTCSPLDKEFSCKSRLLLTIVNQTTDTVLVTLTDSTKVWYYKKADVVIYYDSVTVYSQMFFTDTIDYQWKEDDGCSIYNEKKTEYAIYVTSKNNHGFIDNRFVFPYDTNNAYVTLCKDCLNETYDTIILK